MKVLFFIRSLAVGGSQRQLIMLADRLARRGHKVSVAVFYTGGEIRSREPKRTVRVVPLEKAGRWDAIGPLARLRRLLLSERPDVVYAFQPTQTALMALLLPRRLPTRLVFGVRAAGMEGRRYDALSALTYQLEVWLSRRADLIIANGQAVRADAIRRGMPPDRIVVIDNGIDTDTMRPDAAAGRAQRRTWSIADDAFIVGCVARLDPMKDHATFLHAAAEFGSRHSDARFVCVGDGPIGYRDQLKTLARSLAIEDRLVWAGELADMRAAYNAFNIATLASAFGEGFPNVVAEAMACGIPVVATDVGETPSIVGEFGEVVPPRRPDLLCAGWGRLRQRVTDNPTLGDAARNFILAHYALDAMVDRSESILRRLVAGHSAQELASSC